MMSNLTPMVAHEQINERRRAAELDHIAAVAANARRREREMTLPSWRKTRSLVSRPEGVKLA